MNKIKGFTIIELVVVIAIFSVVISAVVGVFFSVVKQQRRILSEQQLINQTSYVEEYISKALRMAVADSTGSCLGTGKIGYIYLLPSQDYELYKGIKFINQSNGLCQEFFWDTDGFLKEKKGSSSAIILNSSNLQINYIKFFANGEFSDGVSKNDSVQPRATFLLNVSIPGGVTKTIQTTVSQRNLNVK